jgi:hypothetical protein
MGIARAVYVWCLVSIIFYIILVTAFGLIGIILYVIITIGGAIIIGHYTNKADPITKFKKQQSETITMICPACNTVLPEGTEVCPSCGRGI